MKKQHSPRSREPQASETLASTMMRGVAASAATAFMIAFVLTIIPPMPNSGVMSTVAHGLNVSADLA